MGMLTRSAPIPAVYAAPRLIRSMRAKAYRSARRGRIRQSMNRLKISGKTLG